MKNCWGCGCNSNNWRLDGEHKISEQLSSKTQKLLYDTFLDQLAPILFKILFKNPDIYRDVRSITYH